MALINHYTRNADGRFDHKRLYGNPMEFVIANIPDGVPFEIYIDEIGENNKVTEDFDVLAGQGTFHIVEGAGGGGLDGIMKVLDPLGVINRINKIIFPSAKAPSTNLANGQSESPNNSLTDRNNKPRPYERTYDICGTVQSIPNDLMTTYRLFDAAGDVVEYGYYDVGRGYLDTPASGITDGDTLLSEITGSSAAVYGPFTSPNSGAPQTVIGSTPAENLFITVVSNEIDGQVLKAQNDLATNVGSSSTASQTGGLIGIIVDPTGDSQFDQFLKVGDIARLNHIRVDFPGPNTGTDLNGDYVVTSVSSVEIRLDITGNQAAWLALGSTTWAVQPFDDATVGPADTYTKSLTDWVTIDRIKSERLVANISADNGMYKDNGKRSKQSASVTAELQYQLIGDDGVPYGPIYTQQGTVTGRSADFTGVSIIATMPVPSAVRVRARRVTDLDLKYEGQVVDEIKYVNLYGQVLDSTPNYGNRTTIHTARKQTPRASAVKQPQIKLIVTEKVQKYLGNGVFDSAWTNNTQAVQSLIRLMRDPVVGGLDLTKSNMDQLLAVQSEVESYFQSTQAGQFCYTFDNYQTTAQDIITTIAEAIFCTSYRNGKNIMLDFERPRMGPEMVFTHRSKTPDAEKWTRQFSDRDAFDSVKYSYIDPDTNIKETITIPPDGGVKTDTYDSKGVRNYQQAYWHAYRRYQKNLLNKVSVEFTATEEGIFAVPGRPISVVKGSRMAPYDGYIIAVNGLELTLSQPVEFTPGDDHSIILKKRDGSVQSVAVVAGGSPRKVIMQSAPQEAIYTGNSSLKTEFSFGSEQRHNAQMMLVSTVDPGSDRTVKITAYNYHPDYYLYDGVSPFGRAFSDGFSNGYL